MPPEPLHERPPHFLGLAQYGDWRIKLYGIAADGGSVSDLLVDRARRETLPFLPEPAVSEARYGVGFLVIHRGSEANRMLLDWWESECILCHRLFRSSFERPDEIAEVRDGHPMACVHEMPVQWFERQAWVDTVMRRGLEQGLPACLERRLGS